MIRRPPRSTQSRSSAASDVYKRQEHNSHTTTNHNDVPGPATAAAAASPPGRGTTSLRRAARPLRPADGRYAHLLRGLAEQDPHRSVELTHTTVPVRDQPAHDARRLQ